ncbi:FecR family protein [Dyadobacter arcticus]|uniref:Ferric-dicitrate binding protein FerR (Iron transport regulator) n=1 Tax=Dyadobacter arcticus TaxID=1078754 RepID=A0ABX0UJT0_9BACT|nr:FecR family protein [Dyadobacter arcticus]NIJ53077.1 ferric-dicitrate binding protein FerR (iron transport regulator) [Dyadobacter arcticus]
MPNYRNFLPEELAADPSFRNWILYNDPEHEKLWTEWLELNPDRLEMVMKAKHFLAMTESEFDRISDEEIANEIYRLSHAIGEKTAKKSSIWIRFRPNWYHMAASVLILLFAGWLFNKQTTSQQQSDQYKAILSQITEPLVEVKNTSDKAQLVILEDGSSVLLQPESRITYPKKFENNKREVFLNGEAFFEVAKNPDKPFYVYAHTLATKVLGTSFKVSAFDDDKEVKVVVKTGKVSVFPMTKEALASEHANDELGGMVLTPNQQITYTAKELRLTRSLVPNPKLLELPIQSQSFEFKKTPITEVFATLEKSYGVTIIFDGEVMQNCYLTASLSDEPLFEKINLICKTIGAQYEQMDASIIITSKGCW